MVKIFVLIEQALGYGILSANNCKTTDHLLSLLKERQTKKLLSEVNMVKFQQFTSIDNAARNCSDIANGIVSEDLYNLLYSIFSNEKKSILVVNDKKLLESLKSLNINPELSFFTDNNIIFYLREIRHNMHLFMNRSEVNVVQSQIGLGHGYSRVKIKYNVNRSDNMIIQTINLVDQMDKDINTMSMRLREWFGYHYPELFKIVPDIKLYAKVTQLIKCRGGINEEKREKLEEILQDSLKVDMIYSTSRTSMGYELTEEDFLNITAFADKVLMMVEQRELTLKYLSNKMRIVAPNFSTLVGDIVAARLISHAGSLINLAKFPASTIQILGAEKALFRAIKTRGNTPKYGLIFHSSFIGRAAKGDKGRISRFLAAKISLAVRLDCFMDEPINIYGKHLKKHVEDQLVYLETGKEPKKNYEMMEAAVKEAKDFISQLKLKKENEELVQEKSKKKSMKMEHKEEPVVENVEKKKKKNKAENVTEESKKSIKVESVGEPVLETVEKKKKKKKNKDENVKEESAIVEVKAEVKEENIDVSEKKKKKKKRKSIEAETVKEESVVKQVEIKVESVEPEKKKKKKHANEINSESVSNVEVKVENVATSEKKKKKRKTEDLENKSMPIQEPLSGEPEKKKKKKNKE